MSNEIVSSRRRKIPMKLQTWSTWALIGCNSWSNNHPNTHPPTAMTRVRCQQRRIEKAWWRRSAIEQKYERSTRRDAVIGTAVDHRQCHRVVIRHNIAANIAQGKVSAGSLIRKTSTPQTVRIANNLVAMALPTHLQKVCRMPN